MRSEFVGGWIERGKRFCIVGNLSVIFKIVGFRGLN